MRFRSLDELRPEQLEGAARAQERARTAGAVADHRNVRVALVEADAFVGHAQRFGDDVHDVGPENRWALEHGQDTIRVAIRNIIWINDHPKHLDWIVDKFPIKADAAGQVVDDLVKLDPEQGFLRPDGTPLPVEYVQTGTLPTAVKSSETTQPNNSLLDATMLKDAAQTEDVDELV